MKAMRTCRQITRRKHRDRSQEGRYILGTVVIYLFLIAAFDLDFEDHGFHHFFFLGIVGRAPSIVGVIGVAAVKAPALLFRLFKTRRAGGPVCLGSSFGDAICGNLREKHERRPNTRANRLLTLQRRPGNSAGVQL